MSTDAEFKGIIFGLKRDSARAFFLHVRFDLEKVRDLKEALRGNGEIEIQFSDCFLTAAQLADLLAGNENVFERIGLANTYVGDAAGRMFADLLQKSTTLTHLCLGNCGIGESGLSVIFSAVAKNTTILQMSFDGNAFGPSSLDLLVKAIEENTSLVRVYAHDYIEMPPMHTLCKGYVPSASEIAIKKAQDDRYERVEAALKRSKEKTPRSSLANRLV